jgi:hypothetical protein
VKLFRVSVGAALAVSLLALTACTSEHPGPKGLTGAHGQIGNTGVAGASGAQGANGATGPAGDAGSRGGTGTAGSPGATGPAGAPGAAGPTGPAPIPEYGYFYNLAAQTVASHGDVLFSNSGDTSSGITHALDASQIVVNVAGEYEITFAVSVVDPGQFALTLNHRVVPGTVFGAASGEQQDTGTVILSVAAGDVLTVQNVEATNADELDAFAGGNLEDSDATFAIREIG